MTKEAQKRATCRVGGLAIVGRAKGEIVRIGRRSFSERGICNNYRKSNRKRK